MAIPSIFQGDCCTGQDAADCVECKQEGMRAQPLRFSIGEQRTVLAAKPVAYADPQRPSQRCQRQPQRRQRGS